MDTILVGYSINLLREDYDWSKERRSKYLIDPSIKLPKSVDGNVWEENYDYLDKISHHELIDDLTRWRDKNRLVSLTKYNSDNEHRVLVASYLHYFDCVPVEIWAMNYQAENIDSDLLFLGYDVADGGKTSGLSNCGYTKTELEYCRDKFRKHLNHHGLFEDFERANEFLVYSNQRVPNHCPFYIYSLYTDKTID